MANQRKILILGANGMLGHDLAEIFFDQKPILWDMPNLDITDEFAVKQKLADLMPSLVINAAAYTDVDGAQNQPDLAFKVNADAIGYLAVACQQLGAILVHYSTEYVFSGNKDTGYQEDDKTDPLNIYGQSKAKGEEILKQNCEMFYLIRSSWLYGRSPQVGKPRGLNFVQTMLKLAGEGKEINVVSDQFGKPTYTLDLAKKTREIIETQKPCGIYHAVNEGVCSWYEFAKKIFEIKNISANLNSINSDQYPLPTPRPKYSILVNTKLEPLRKWDEALRDYLRQS
ncbi:MAG: dTDP-4-dehydrorhamnose reductase [Candidatus Buchananbacteria bacterium RIFCSPHIGHO2_01_FULL_39_14]|uniref:dTDP-4-dehydrorhamnose reductase n=1 Tax=Candidatus Buchananbacteria bacterium RIFCSPHIGHO2_01_FULL_39_14 TaxID=1797532 RepID=A0A1G1XTL9_9BACT|nr:MAG: dTDP-4-dehydrorhamnose reductase [Candidatus Buchananbacteria bacterium RIFCSPHIGHO2_01_FULL_39_14]OGY49243.1 MAG: dTDP-4-dehydrorhamnose reductase [Candidatus Buchananbacteria bacterium RIFCSPHIGHO2_02_FULL_39_17]